MKRILSLLATIGLTAMLAIAAPVAAKQFSAWGTPPAQPPQPVAGVNTTSLEGCAMQSPDGLSLYFASDRLGGLGATDIWVAHRVSTDASWGAPVNLVNLGAPINTDAAEVCPTPVRGNGLFFVSARPGGYGLGDIYFARLNPAHGWTAPMNLGSGVNSSAGEAGPSYFEADGHGFLYFSSGLAPNTSQIYVSEQALDGSFGPRAAVTELNSTFDDFRPNVRKDGLEMVFDSNRTGTDGTYGLQDLYTATRQSVDDRWSTPTNLGNVVNTILSEVRGSFSWDAKTLYFGRTGGLGGSMDLWFTTRTR